MNPRRCPRCGLNAFHRDTLDVLGLVVDRCKACGYYRAPVKGRG